MSSIAGGCHCGAVRYQVEGEPIVLERAHELPAFDRCPPQA
jgi:hypothetical protein